MILLSSSMGMTPHVGIDVIAVCARLSYHQTILQYDNEYGTEKLKGYHGYCYWYLFINIYSMRVRYLRINHSLS